MTAARISRLSVGTILTVAVVLACVALFALFVFPQLALRAPGSWFPLGPTTALAAVALSPLVILAAGPGRPWARVTVGAALIAASPVFYLTARIAVDTPLVCAHAGEYAEGLLFAGVILPALAFIASLLAAALPWSWTGRVIVQRILRVAAWAVVVLACVLAIAASRRTVRSRSIDDYLGTVPIVGRIQVGREALPTDTSPPLSNDGMFTNLVGAAFIDGVWFRRWCGSSDHGWRTCVWHLADSHTNANGIQSSFAYGGSSDRRAEYIVRRDPRVHYWLVEGGRYDSCAFDDRTLAQRDVRVADLSAAAGPPWGWIVGAWAGVLVAIGLLLRTTRPPLAPWEQWRDGWHRGGGEVDLGRDGIAHVSPYRHLPVGPVALLPASELGASYRDYGGIPSLQAVPGTVAGLLAIENACTVSRAMLAMAVVLDTSASLVAALQAGLVG